MPRWAMHKLTGGEPSDAFEEEGGESMWELYVCEQGEKKAKQAFEAKAAKQRYALNARRRTAFNPCLLS